MIRSARGRIFVLIGDPVGHSLSPRMQNAAFTALGLDAVYLALRTPADGVAPLMRILGDNGGGGNLTVPHKAAGAGIVSTLRGPLADACNTFWSENGALVGDNTDVIGIKEALAAIGALPSRSMSWLVVGTGGSAKAAAAAARDVGAALAVRSRDPKRAEQFMAAAGALGSAPADGSSCEVIINCTPLGLGGDDPLPVEPKAVPQARWALDLVYAPGETRWVRAMRAAGAVAADGRELLVRQGGAALERWFPGRRAPLEVMRAAVRDGLV